VIDILVPVRELPTSRPAIAALERRHGYLYWPYESDEMHWLCKSAPDVRTHHVHLVPASSAAYHARLEFRDRLRADPELRRRYGELKRRLARECADDREAYTAGKAPFITDALRAVVQLPRKR